MTDEGSGSLPGAAGGGGAGAPLTGRSLVLLREGAGYGDVEQLLRPFGIEELSTWGDWVGPSPRPGALHESQGLLYEGLGVVVAQLSPQRATLSPQQIAEPGSAVLAIEPERFVHALGAHQPTPDYVRGFRDGVDSLASKLLGVAPPVDRTGSDDLELSPTWALEAVAADRSPQTGRGVTIAVLDTGVEARHPDLDGRVTQLSVVSDDPTDRNGHGTHCAAIAAGARNESARAYGVAPDAQVLSIKVLDDSGRGDDGDVLAGMDLAIVNRCRVVSLSLGASGPPSAIVSVVMERALRRGLVVVAAAGNDSARPAYVAELNYPASCSTVLAVGAVDRHREVARFSNGGGIDLVAPGVDIRSAAPLGTGEPYATMSGTSMATPAVAGVAALWAEATQAPADELVERLRTSALPLRQPASDVGYGLVQAPLARGVVASEV